jgi:hypothetical protein
MRTRIAIAALIWPMIQAVLFGVGVLVVLATVPAAGALTAIWWMVGATVLISAPLAWLIAPRLRLRKR